MSRAWRFAPFAVAFGVLALLIVTVQRAYAVVTVPNMAKYVMTAPSKIDGDHPGFSAPVPLPVVNSQFIAMAYCSTKPFRYSGGPIGVTVFTGEPWLATTSNNPDGGGWTLEIAQFQEKNYMDFMHCGAVEPNNDAVQGEVSVGWQLDESNLPTRMVLINRCSVPVTATLTLIW